MQLPPYVLAVDDYSAAQAVVARVVNCQHAARWRRGTAVAKSVVVAVLAPVARAALVVESYYPLILVLAPHAAEPLD